MKNETKVSNSIKDLKDSLGKLLTLVKMNPLWCTHLMLEVLISQQEILLVRMMVCLLLKEWVEEKDIDQSLVYVP